MIYPGNARPRVLMVASTYKPILGGMVEYAYQIARAFKRRGAGLRVLSLACPGSDSYDRQTSISIERTRPGIVTMNDYRIRTTITKAQGLWRMAAAAVRVAKQWRADLVYLPTSYPLGNLFRRLPAKVVITFHGAELRHYTEASLFRPLHKKLLLRSCRTADLILVNSAYTARLVEEQGVADSKIYTTGCGADWSRFEKIFDAQQAKRDLALAGKKVILTLGKLIERKGFDMVLRCLPAIRRKHPDVFYVVVGAGPMAQSLDALAHELGVADCVRFAGRVTDEVVLRYMAACDVFAMPNRETSDGSVEGFGIVFLEANACGKPVVAGRSGGAVDAVVDGETGYLVPPQDEEEVAHAICTLLGDPVLAARLGQQGRRRVDREYRWETVADRAVQRMMRLLE